MESYLDKQVRGLEFECQGAVSPFTASCGRLLISSDDL